MRAGSYNRKELVHTVMQRVIKMESSHEYIYRDPDILGGKPVFVGTRVPVEALLEYLSAGQTLDDFLDDFPSVTRPHAKQVLDHAKEMLVASAHFV
jgi:uncharacterized protein (DUF433 family)